MTERSLLVRFVDPVGDVVFNERQASRLAADVQKALRSAEGDNSTFSTVLDLVQRCANGTDCLITFIPT